MSENLVSVLGGDPSYRRLAVYSLPLALSGLVINAEFPLVSAGVARLPDPETGLAAFGVAVTIAYWIESPIVMLLDAATARCADARSYRLLRRYALGWSVVLTALLALLAFTPLHEPVLRDLLGLSGEIARETVPALAIFLPWPAMVAWRRFHQGVLIRQGQTRVVGYVVLVRLLSVTLVTTVGAVSGALSGASLGALALSTGVVVEGIIIHQLAKPFARRLVRLDRPEPDGIDSLWSFNRYYLPLIGTAMLFVMISSVITAGLARADEPSLSLAVWPVAYSLVFSVASPITGLQQVAIRLATESETARHTRRLMLGAGMLLAGLLIVGNVTGVTRLVLEQGIGVSERLAGPAMSSIWLMTLLPAVIALRSLQRGILIRRRDTKTIQLAAATNVALLSVVLFGAAEVVSLPGYALAAVALLAATVVEATILLARTLRLQRRAALESSGRAPLAA